MGRCSGHCCKAFTLPYSPDEIWATYQRWRNQGTLQPIMKNGQLGTSGIPIDIFLIAPMLVYKGLMFPPFKQVRPDEPRIKHHIYTCKHFDAKKKCTIYEYRPQMCRDYPYGKSCNYVACTWKERKEKPETAKERKLRLTAIGDMGGGLVLKDEVEEK